MSKKWRKSKIKIFETVRFGVECPKCYRFDALEYNSFHILTLTKRKPEIAFHTAYITSVLSEYKLLQIKFNLQTIIS